MWKGDVRDTTQHPQAVLNKNCEPQAPTDNLLKAAETSYYLHRTAVTGDILQSPAMLLALHTPHHQRPDIVFNPVYWALSQSV